MSEISVFNIASLDENKDFLKTNKWASVQNILSDDYADDLYNALVNEAPWKLILKKNQDRAEISDTRFAQMSLSEKQQLMQQFYGADFAYKHCRLDKHDLDAQLTDSMLAKVSEYFNAEEFLSALKQFTGDEMIQFCDCRATCYQRGHYLRQHDDFLMGHNRRYAYVLNLTKNWKPDWGGALHILGHDSSYKQSLMPTFNALNIFLVPTPHYVSMIAPYAEEDRISITGWFYA